MRNNISRSVLSIISALVLFVTLVASSAAAGTSRSLVVQIPFDFHIGSKTLPAGKYVVERSTQASAEGLSLRGIDTNAGAFVLTSTVQSRLRQSDSRLVFNRYQDKYFLAQYWTSGEASGRELIKSDKERAAEREIARAGAKAERVALVVTQAK